MKLMTAEEVRSYLNLKSVRTVYRHVNDGTLPHYRIGTQIRFKQEEIDEAMKGGNNAKKGRTRSRSYPASSF